MNQALGSSISWVIGALFLVVGAIIFVSVSANFSLAQGGNQPTNLNMNVNNVPPLFNGAQLFHDNGGVTAISSGDTVPGIIGGSVNVIMNVNVTDLNGFDTGEFSILSGLRLVRTTGGSNYYLNTDGEGSLYDVANNASATEEHKLPMAGPTSCVDYAYYNAGTGVNTGVKIHCSTQIYYFSDPTTTGSSVNSTTNFEANRWQALVYFTDRGGYQAYESTGIYFEYPNILGLSVTPAINMGAITATGIPSNLVNATVQNQGNQQIDVALKATKDTDATAWVCAGGYPLVSDVHHAVSGGATDYASMTPLALNSGTHGTEETAFDLVRTSIYTSPITKDERFRFSTVQTIKPGLCALSSILVTAFRGY